MVLYDPNLMKGWGGGEEGARGRDEGSERGGGGQDTKYIQRLSEKEKKGKKGEIDIERKRKKSTGREREIHRDR